MLTVSNRCSVHVPVLVFNNNKKPKRLENSQLLKQNSHLNQIFELILKECVANYYYGDNTIAK